VETDDNVTAFRLRARESFVEQIRIEVTSQEQAELKSVKKIDPDAYEDYLKARAYLATNRKAEAVELLNDLKAQFQAIRSPRKLPWSIRPWATKTKP
jgi:hypothetical protein